jgi:hypothetical protein
MGQQQSLSVSPGERRLTAKSGHSVQGIVASSHKKLEAHKVTARNSKKWLDLVALVAVMGGLVLVAYEIRQANFFAKAETENSIFTGWETLSMAEIESGINAVVARSIEDPASISTADRSDISSWLTAVISLYQRNGIMFYEYGLAADPDYPGVGAFYFASQTARDWFEVNESWIRRETPELADEIRQYIDSTTLD